MGFFLFLSFFSVSVFRQTTARAGAVGDRMPSLSPRDTQAGLTHMHCLDAAMDEIAQQGGNEGYCTYIQGDCITPDIEPENPRS